MCKKSHFCASAGECPLKNADQIFLIKTVVTLVFKLKALEICKKVDLGGI